MWAWEAGAFEYADEFLEEGLARNEPELPWLGLDGDCATDMIML